MFNALSIKEKILFFFFPLAMIAVIIFLGWQANKWSAEAAREQERREMWQDSYIKLTAQIDDFNRRQTEILTAVAEIKQQHQKNNEELHNALQNNQDWSNQPVPDDIKRVFGPAESH